jgi:hypothetical protein
MQRRYRYGEIAGLWPGNESTWRSDIARDAGNRKLRAVVNSNPISRSVGVPNTNIPMPNTDWTIEKIAITARIRI